MDSLPDPYFMQFGYSNPHDTEGLMDLLSAGCQVLFFVTGRGSPVGAPLAPVVKITGNSGTFRKMEEDMDFDAGPILSGEMTFDEACLELGEPCGKNLPGRSLEERDPRPQGICHRLQISGYRPAPALLRNAGNSGEGM